MNTSVVRYAAYRLPCLLFLLLAAEGQASAYVDPGSGAAYYQILLIGVVGVLFRVRRIAGWFRSRKTTSISSENDRG